MANENDAVFNEVLQISANPDQFIADLQKIEEAWSQSLARMAQAANAADGNPISAITASSSTDFAALRTSLDGIVQALSVSFEALATTVSETMSRAEAAIQKVIDKEGQVGKGAADATTSVASINQGGEIAVSKDINYGTLDPEAQAKAYTSLRDLEAQGIEVYDALNAASKKWFTAYADNEAKRVADGKASDEQLVQSNEEASQSLEAAADRVYQVKTALLEKFGADYSAAEARIVAANRTEGTDDSTEMLQTKTAALNKFAGELETVYGRMLTLAKGEMNQELAETERTETQKQTIRERTSKAFATYLDQQFEAATREMEAELAATERSEQDKQAIREKTLKAFATYLDQQYDAALKEMNAEVAAAEKAEQEKLDIRERSVKAQAQFEALPQKQQDKISGETNVGASFIDGLIPKEGLSGIAATVGQLTQWLVIFKAIQVVLDAIKEVIFALPNALAEGLSFLEQMQQKAVELQPVLAQSFSLSPDFQTNFQLAGKAAEQVVLDLRERAAELNLDFEKVLVTFKDFSAGGGGGLVQNMKEAEEVSLLMERSIKAMTSDQRESKTIQQEIPQLLNGSIGAQSKFLELTGITKDQWLSILNSSKEHHDLLLELTPLLQNFAQAGDKLPATFKDLQAEFSQFLQELEGNIAQATFEELNALAVQFGAFLKDNKSEIQGITLLIGQMVGAFLPLLASLAGILNDTGVWAVLLAAVRDGIVAIVAPIATTVNLLTLVSELMKAIASIDLSRGVDGLRESWDKATAAVAAYLTRSEAIGNSVQAALGGTPVPNPGDDLTRQNTGDTSRLPINANTTEATKVHKELTEQLKAEKSAYDDIRISAKSLADDQKGDASAVAANSAIIIKSYDDELAAQEKIIDKYLERIALDQTLSATQKSDLASEAVDQRFAAEAAHDKAVAAEKKAARKEELQDALNDYHEQLSEIETNAAKEIAISKDLEANHVITAEQGRAQRKAIYDAEYQDIVKLVNDSTTLLREHGATTKQFDPAKTINQAEVNDIKGNTAEDKAGNAEQEQIAQSKYRQLIKMQQEFYAQSLAIDKEAHSQGLTNESTYAAAVLAAENNRFAQERAILLTESRDQAVSDTARAEALQKLQTLESQHNQAVILDTQKLSAARAADEAEQIRSQEAVNTVVAEAAVKHKEAADRLIGDNVAVKKDIVELEQIRYNELTVELAHAQAQLAAADLNDTEGKKVDELREKIAKLTAARQADADAIKQGGGSVVSTSADTDSGAPGLGRTALNDAFGSTNVELLKSGNTLKEFQGGLGALNNAIKDVMGVINDVKQGIKQGGTLGGIGAGLTDAAKFDPEPISKAILSIAGTVTSLLGSFFEAAAKAIADNAKKEFASIQQNIQNNVVTLGEGIQQLQAEKQQAIEQLSHVKDGQDQLKTLIPQFDQAIAQLVAQQKQIKDNFTDQVAILGQQTQVGQQWLSDWKDINAQVKQYLDAGGSQSEATQFLKDKLASMTQSINDQYNTAEQAAVKDSLSLNDMLTQRVQLQESITKNLDDQKNIQDQIAKITATENDSIVRREAGAITAAQVAADKRKTLQDQLTADKTQVTADQTQLTDLNEQIDLQTARVSAEQKIFGISTDIATLHRTDEQLSMAALQEEIANWTELKNLTQTLNSAPPQINPATGLFYGNSPFANTPGGIPGINTNPPQTGAPVSPEALEQILNKALAQAHKDNPNGPALKEFTAEVNDTLKKFSSGALSQQDTLSYLLAEKDYAVNHITDQKSLADVLPALTNAINLLSGSGSGSGTSGLTPAPPVTTGTTVLQQQLNSQLQTLTGKVQTTSTDSTTALTATLNTQLAAVTTAVNTGSTAIVAKLTDLSKPIAPSQINPAALDNSTIQQITGALGGTKTPVPAAPISIVLSGPIHIGAGVDPYTSGRQVGQGIADEFEYRYRAGVAA